MVAETLRDDMTARGLLRATSSYQDVYDSTWKVDKIDTFISHSWSGGRWGKTLAVCFEFNLGLAVKASCFAYVAVSVGLLQYAGGFGTVTALETLGGTPWLLALAVDVPVAIFFLVYFFGHLLTCSGRSLWLDKICIDQTSVVQKEVAIDSLPHFVQRSSKMLVLWDDTYFQRLWCNLEIALFMKDKVCTKSLRLVPLWLPPWLLTSIVLEWALSRFVLPILIAEAYGLNILAASPPQAYIEYLQRGVFFCGVSVIAHIPSAFVAAASFITSIQQHGALLDQLSSFDVRSAMCSVESDRVLLESRIARLYDEIEDEPKIVAFDSRVQEVSAVATSPCDEEHVAFFRRQSVRCITSYPSEEQCLDLFNEYVRRDLLREIIADVGGRADMRPSMCGLVFMPFWLMNFSVSFLACEGLPDCLMASQVMGYPSLRYIYIVDGSVNFLMMVFTLPVIFPLLLKLVAMSLWRVHTCFGRLVLAMMAGLLTYTYVFLLSGVMGGSLTGILILGPTWRWLACFVLSLAVIILQWYLVFFGIKPLSFACRTVA
mmetsp:Transcript_54731/g.127720  ORF Transcript_54731/g.127720 Transcript_54731/m.127720 type:complete len:544 (-) Transcript_54731:149-1780(-)